MPKEKQITLGVINLMPNKLETEKQWQNLIHAVNDQVTFRWIRMKTHQPKSTPLETIKHYYATFDEVDMNRLEGVILTGAPVEKLPFESVTYWKELIEVVEALTERQIPILAICWGAQALAHMRWKLEKIELNEKCFGIFEHDVISPLFKQKIGDVISMPHSRHTGWSNESVQRIKPLKPLIHSDEAGIFLMEDAYGDYYVTGHMEYDRLTLVREYERDLLKGLQIKPPVGSGFWDQSAKGIMGIWLNEKIVKRGQL